MKITEKSADRLVLSDEVSLVKMAMQPILVLGTLCGILAIVLFLIFRSTSYKGKYTELTCSRPEDYVVCKYIQTDGSGQQIKLERFTKIKKAVVQPENVTRKECDSDGDNCVTREYQVCHIRLVSDRGTISIPDISEFAQQSSSTCALTNTITVNVDNLVKGKSTQPLTWATDTTTGDSFSTFLLNLKYAPGSVKIIFTTIIFSILVKYIQYCFNLSSNIWTFDRKLGTLTQEWKKLWRKGITKYPLTDIKGIGYDLFYPPEYHLFVTQRKQGKLDPKKLPIFKFAKLEESELEDLLNLLTPFCLGSPQCVQWGQVFAERDSQTLSITFKKPEEKGTIVAKLSANKKDGTVLTERRSNWFEKGREYQKVASYDIATIEKLIIRQVAKKDSYGNPYFVKTSFFKSTDQKIYPLDIFEPGKKKEPAYQYTVYDIEKPIKYLAKFLDLPVEKEEMCGGVFDVRAFNPDQIKSVAELPTREVLLAKVMSMIKNPSSRLAGTINGVSASLGRAINEVPASLGRAIKVMQESKAKI